MAAPELLQVAGRRPEAAVNLGWPTHVYRTKESRRKLSPEWAETLSFCSLHKSYVDENLNEHGESCGSAPRPRNACLAASMQT